MSKYKSTGKQTLFDAENAAQKLSEIGNPLEKLDSVIDFEMFRSRLEEAMMNHNTKSNAGAKQYDVVMMFKVMVLRQYYNLSYEQTEYQIIDRSSFKQFLGLASGDKVPDANYVGQEETLQRYELKDEICEKGYRGKPLTDEQREENRKKSVICSRVEHVFGFMEGAMHGLTVRTIGIARATAHIFLKCLTYNMFRYGQFVRNGIR